MTSISSYILTPHLTFLIKSFSKKGPSTSDRSTRFTTFQDSTLFTPSIRSLRWNFWRSSESRPLINWPMMLWRAFSSRFTSCTRRNCISPLAILWKKTSLARDFMFCWILLYRRHLSEGEKMIKGLCCLSLIGFEYETNIRAFEVKWR